MDAISTKNLIKAIEDLKLKKEFKKVLIVTNDANTFLSGRNVSTVSVQKLSGLSVEQVVHHDVVVISKEDVKTLEGLVK